MSKSKRKRNWDLEEPLHNYLDSFSTITAGDLQVT